MTFPHTGSPPGWPGWLLSPLFVQETNSWSENKKLAAYDGFSLFPPTYARRSVAVIVIVCWPLRKVTVLRISWPPLFWPRNHPPSPRPPPRRRSLRPGRSCPGRSSPGTQSRQRPDSYSALDKEKNKFRIKGISSIPLMIDFAPPLAASPSQIDRIKIRRQNNQGVMASPNLNLGCLSPWAVCNRLEVTDWYKLRQTQSSNILCGWSDQWRAFTMIPDKNYLNQNEILSLKILHKSSQVSVCLLHSSAWCFTFFVSIILFLQQTILPFSLGRWNIKKRILWR